MKRITCVALLTCVTAFLGCDGTPDDLFDTSSSKGSSTVSSSSGSTSGDGGSGGETSTTASTATTAGTGGAEPVFAAQCSGVLDCPSLAGCAEWTYDLTDDGADSDVTAVITILQPEPAPPCTETATFVDDEETGPVKDSIVVQCGQQAWTLGLDRGTMTVYIKADPIGFSWTPSCR